MADEIDDLRAHTKWLASENENLKGRIHKATEYLELIQGDRTILESERIIVETALDNLREDIQ